MLVVSVERDRHHLRAEVEQGHTILEAGAGDAELDDRVSLGADSVGDLRPPLDIDPAHLAPIGLQGRFQRANPVKMGDSGPSVGAPDVLMGNQLGVLTSWSRTVRV